jgi:hypothetical protein
MLPDPEHVNSAFVAEPDNLIFEDPDCFTITTSLSIAPEIFPEPDT